MEGFSVPVSIAFTVNYVVGAGSLTLPWAFHQAGCTLGVILLAIMSYFSLSAVLFLLESMARSDRLTISIDESSQLLQDNSIINTKAIIRKRKYEISELCDIHLGTIGKTLYTFIICLYMYGTLWAYASVFASSLSAHFMIGDEISYYLFLTLFSILVLPISCMELSEQVPLQVSLSICRILMIVLMCSTIFVAYITSTNPFIQFKQLQHEPISTIHFNNLYILLPIAAYANVFHHSIPALAQPVADKSKLSLIFGTTILFCFLAYSLVGCVISSYFGDDIKSSSNLNWISYNGHGNPNLPTPLYAQIIAAYIVCFPSLDVASAFPLCVITLGNNLLSSFYGKDVVTIEKSRLHRVTFRLLAAVPPLIGACFESNLGKITKVAGISGFAVAFIFPSLLGMASQTKLESYGLNASTIYGGILTCRLNQKITLCLGVFLILFVGVSIMRS